MMLDKIIGFKNSPNLLYRIMFWVLIPLILILLIIKFITDSNIINALKDLRKTELKDFELQKKQEEAERKARELEKQANEHGAAAEKHENEAKDSHVDLDWHKKRE